MKVYVHFFLYAQVVFFSDGSSGMVEVVADKETSEEVQVEEGEEEIASVAEEEFVSVEVGTVCADVQKLLLFSFLLHCLLFILFCVCLCSILSKLLYLFSYHFNYSCLQIC